MNRRVKGQTAARRRAPVGLDRCRQLHRVDSPDSFRGTEMTQVVRVPSGQARGHRPSLPRHHEVRNARQTAKHRNPRLPVSQTPSGGLCPEESASERKDLGPDWKMRISFSPRPKRKNRERNRFSGTPGRFLDFCSFSPKPPASGPQPARLRLIRLSPFVHTQ